MESLHEEWRPVKAYEGQYEISNRGRVRSLDRDVTCLSRWGTPRVIKLRGQIVRHWKPKCGYSCVSLNANGVGVNYQVHRLVAAAFIGEPGGMHVNHIDGNKLNNASSNLEYVTPKQNTAHAMANGLMPLTGERNPSAKNTADRIRKAHAMVAGGSTYTKASAATGVGVSAIVGVCVGRTWQSLGLPVIRRSVGWNQFSQSKPPEPAA